MTDLMLHRGARLVETEELAACLTPPPTKSWFPISHGSVLTSVLETLNGSGFNVARQQLALSKDNARFFGTLDLATPIRDGVSLSVGIRNSVDKSFPIGWCCGNRVFCCDNLSFTSEIVIAKKHTRFGQERYLEGIAKAVASLHQYQATAAEWIDRLESWELTADQANSLILQAFEKELISTRLLPDLIAEWRQPSKEVWQKRNAWSLWNCFTQVLSERQKTNPSQAALTTIRLQKLLQPEVIDVEHTKVEEVLATAG